MHSCSRLATNAKEKEMRTISLLGLPALILENIFERLLPADLCCMVRVCSFLREMCASDHLWEKQLKRKWGKVIGDAAHQEWKSLLTSRNTVVPIISGQKKKKGLLKSIRNMRPLSWIRQKVVDKSSNLRTSSTLPIDSIMAFYLSLESGKFWFPAQIYYGEPGCRDVCYDARVCYDSRTNTFQARYPSQGWGTEAIEWDRLRAPQVNTPPYMFHVSDCLNDLKPGDHIEIRWTSHKDLPYGWWYAIIGHLEACDESENRCRCQYNETIIVEFDQFPRGSKWRKIMINRKKHSGEGNIVDGFYGGIRKLHDEEKITKRQGFEPNYDGDDNTFVFNV